MAKYNNLGVADQEFYDAGKMVADYGDLLQRNMKEYCESLMLVCETAIKDQQINDRLMSICEDIEVLRKEISEMTEKLAKNSASFVKKIDEADKFLY